MKLYWDPEVNCLITSAPCSDCGGFKWWILSEKTEGTWMPYMCSDAEPSETDFKKITHEPPVKEAP